MRRRRMLDRDEVATVQVTGGGIGFFGLLGVVFIVLKLTGIIDWSWLWVLAPLWMPFCFIMGLVVFASITIIAITMIRIYKSRY